MSPAELAPHVEFALLRADATRDEIEKHCAVAREQRFRAVQVGSSRVALARHFLDESDVKVGCAIDFPLGAAEADVKRYEIEVALDHGAQEFEVVLNHGWLREGNAGALLRELRDAVEAADELPVKVMIESTLVMPEHLAPAVKLIAEAEAKFVTLSHLFGMRGASLETLAALKQAAGSALDIKIFANLETFENASAILAAGASRLGVLSVPKA
jgi:deoxyribose-phosphate aldolase